MKWRRRESPQHDHDPGLDEAHEALERALESWPAVQETVQEMRNLRRENHLGPRVRIALGGGRK